MTGFAGNGRNAYSGYNPLCDTLRAKYADRVRRAANAGTPGYTAHSRRQTPPAEADLRSERTHHSAGSQSAEARSNRRQTMESASAGSYGCGAYMGSVASDMGADRRGYTPQRNVYSDRTAFGYGYAADRAGRSYRSGAAQSRGGAAEQSGVRRRSSRYEAPKAKNKKQSFMVSTVHHIKEKIEVSNREARRQKAAEIKLTKKPFPKGAMLSALLCTVMLLVMLFSYAQVYEMNRTISRQRSEGEALVDEAEKLQVELELKDDIRTIERIATEEIGMVKSDRVDTRYISVSGGERIDVIESPEDQTEDVNMFTTLLSAIGENFEKILDRIE